MKSSVFAIDNGLDGYCCFLQVDGTVKQAATPVARGRVSRSVLHLEKADSGIDYRPLRMLQLIDIAIAADPDVAFVIEEPSVGFKAGESSRKSRDSQMRGFGMWCAAVAIRERLLYTVYSTTWKSYFKLIGKPKDKSIAIAQALYPGCVFPTHDAADACLIATFFKSGVEIEVRPRNARQKTRTGLVPPAGRSSRGRKNKGTSDSA